jgi:O-antigen ligase
LRACLPLLLLAATGIATTAHRLHVLDAVADLAIGCAALVGWSLAFRAARLRRLLDATLLAGAPLALLGVLQAYELWTPLVFATDPGGARQATTSLLGNPGDLAALLVLPCLLAQQRLAVGPRRPLWGAAAALCAYGVATSQTLTSFAALAAGSLLLWALLLPPRRLAVLAAAGAVAVILLVALAPGLRARVLGWRETFALGGLNNVLSGRLDGWRVATALLAERPLTGVGHGAYRAEFAPAKLALAARGVPFYEHHINPSFANAHNEYLEVGAGLGWPGLLALAWGAGWLALAARRRAGASRSDGALAWAGLLALGLLAAAYFPFRLGPVAFGWVAFFAWLFAAGGEEEVTAP